MGDFTLYLDLLSQFPPLVGCWEQHCPTRTSKKTVIPQSPSSMVLSGRHRLALSLYWLYLVRHRTGSDHVTSDHVTLRLPSGKLT